MYQRPLTSDEIYHSLFGNMRKEWKNHKYIKKIDGRYFYDAAEVKAYLNSKLNAGKKAAQNTANKIYNAAGGKYKTQVDNAKREADAYKRSAKGHRNELISYANKARDLENANKLQTLAVAKNEARNRALEERDVRMRREKAKRKAHEGVDKDRFKVTKDVDGFAQMMKSKAKYIKTRDQYRLTKSRAAKDYNANKTDSTLRRATIANNKRKADQYDTKSKAYAKSLLKYKVLENNANRRLSEANAKYEKSIVGKYDSYKAKIRSWAEKYANAHGYSKKWVDNYVNAFMKKKKK